MIEKYIEIKGAEVNNLKKIDLKIPRDKLVVISGVSGSGKSSLAFDTLFAEGQRRFAESLSSFARQFLGRMTKPAVEKIEGIPPAIAIEQKVNSRNPRSTVGTTTEIYDYLRVLFSRIGKTYSPISGVEVKKENVQTVISYIETLKPRSYVHILSPFGWGNKDYRVEKLLELKELGFTRIYRDGEILKIDSVLSDIAKFDNADLFLLIDRFIADGESLSQEQLVSISDSLEKAFTYGSERLSIAVRENKDSKDDIKVFSNLFEADGIVFEEPNEWMFSFNSPMGACPHCGGYGKVEGIDEKLVVPERTKTIYEGAIACWRGDTMKYFYEELVNSAHLFDFPIHKPYNELTKANKNLIWLGNEHFTGLDKFFEMVKSNRYKIQFKYLLSRYTGKSICPECLGSRLKKEVLHVKIVGTTIADLLSMTISDLLEFFKNLNLSEYDMSIAERALVEIKQRLKYMNDVGLSYLTLSRASNTLSGGESQRINLVSSLGSGLVGSLYILDEPSIGLHPRDTQRLISILKDLRDLGNTVILVEHDDEIIRSADYLIDIGPMAGTYGGEVVYQGPPLLEKGNNNNSLTLKYIQGDLTVNYPPRNFNKKSFIEIKGVVENNLKSVDAKFPLNCLTVVTGVSGSGKSSLVGATLYPAMNRIINQLGLNALSFKEIVGDYKKIGAVEYIDQNPIGKSSRSNPVTYLKIYDDIRKLMSEQPYSKMNGYGSSCFSFNIDGGRCPECQGDGIIKIPMQFMADVQMVCESCDGKRFKPDILEVRYKGKNVYDILEMSVDDAIEFFSSQKEVLAKKVAERLKPLKAVGLSYLQLGQNSSTLSGGESQRVKLAFFLSKDNKQKSTLFIFDEPTTGLHFYDIQNLMNSFMALLDNGHTIVVVEHNMAVVRCADWIIDIGPDGGREGGYIVYQGEIDGIKSVKNSFTREYI